MSSASVLHVACGADENYLPHAATMLASLLDHHPPASVHAHFLHPADLAPELLARLERFVRGRGAQLTCHAFADDTIAGLPSWPGLRPVMWYRVMLPERLPHLDRVLYVDADAVVLDDLRPLWETPLGEAWLGAVTNVAPPLFADHPLTLGLPNRASYFNSGVMLLNLGRMRAANSARALLDYGRAHRLKWWDQDALNIFFHRERLSLHPRWTSMNCVFLFPESCTVFGEQAVAEARTRPAIVHFEGPGPGKPWHYLSKHPYRERYLAYRAQTPWPLQTLDGRTWKNRVLRLLPTRAILAVLGFEYRARQLAHRLRARLLRARGRAA
jgi:lipopolysaccharide biosynthesis glycosyltransferase